MYGRMDVYLWEDSVIGFYFIVYNFYLNNDAELNIILTDVEGHYPDLTLKKSKF